VGYSDQAQARPKWAPPAVEQLAPLFPELDILELIGRGGMGAVYKARQNKLDRLVALKILPPEIGREPAFAQRFAREAQAMAKLGHPNIVTIYDFGQRGGLYFFLMEYVDGLSLRQLLSAGGERSRTTSPKEALAIVPQICDALQYAHDRGIVHRDIKPENILLNRAGQVKIADFGLAKLVGGSTGVGGTGLQPVQNDNGVEAGSRGAPGLTQAGEKVMGTPQYMAPEQIDRPGEVDHRADIYSLGVVFYQMLTGELPKGRPGETFEPPSRKVLIDVRLDEVVLRALEKEPARRYQQVSQVRTEVETIVATPPADVQNPAVPDKRSEPPLAGAIGTVAAPRFSRLAIIAAVWAGIGLIGILLLTIA
jgi:serine/threonine protein kinase